MSLALAAGIVAVTAAGAAALIWLTVELFRRDHGAEAAFYGEMPTCSRCDKPLDHVGPSGLCLRCQELQGIPVYRPKARPGEVTYGGRDHRG